MLATLCIGTIASLLRAYYRAWLGRPWLRSGRFGFTRASHGFAALFRTDGYLFPLHKKSRSFRRYRSSRALYLADYGGRGSGSDLAIGVVAGIFYLFVSQPGVGEAL